MQFLTSLLVLMLVVMFPAKACEVQVRHQFMESSKDRLVLSLLKLSLSKVSDDICYSELAHDVSSARESNLTQKNVIDVYWASTSSLLHKDNLAIRQPIFKGILGHRLLVIRDGEQHRFDNIETIQQLRKLVAGQGDFWGDTKVLKASGIPVMTSTRGRRLWDMLAEGRFDYLPLAVHEPWEDIKIRPNHNLTVENQLMLVYPMAMYFYVNQRNQKLYALISEGMKKALSDGSYDEVLMSSSIMKTTAKYANIANRKIIFMNNPDWETTQDFQIYRQQTQQLVDLINNIDI
ncbi:MAG: diguanylate cyclase [Gammaproteobacteria bacterium]|nr:diguanylate cyclase [Gammaproteobacteria bacterium]